jgi:hypothetical protein
MDMNTRCTPGDLAIINFDVLGCEDNIGRLVLVRGPAAIDFKGQLTWLITPISPEPYVVDIPATGGFRFMEVGESIIEHPDDWMTPISLEELEEEVESDEIVEA